MLNSERHVDSRVIRHISSSRSVIVVLTPSLCTVHSVLSSLKKLFSLTAGSTSSFEVRVYTYWQLLPSGAVATSEEVGVGREWIPTCNALRVLEDPLKLTARRLGLQGDRG